MCSLFRSTTVRFVALVFLSQVLLTGGILAFVQKSSTGLFVAEQKALVGELRDGLVADYRADGELRLISQIKTRLQTMHAGVTVILLARADGKVAVGNLGAWPATVPQSTSWQIIKLYRTGNDRPETMGIIATRLPGGAHLLTGHVLDTHLRLTKLNQEAMISAFLLAIPLALLLALALSRLINGRVRSIAATAEAVRGGDLSHRVVLDNSGDAFDTLGRGVNTMLERIDALVSELRIVTDGLAHDLRSPITRLKSTLERAMIDTQDPIALKALEKVSVEAEALLTMLSTALQISRAEAGVGRERFIETDVSALLEDLVEIYGPVAEDQGMVLSSSADAGLTVSLHRELLSQALGNLIENALKYARGGRHIALNAVQEDGGLTLSVSDDGPGIPEDRRADARRKFGRLDPARHVTGSGLGLSLVEAVVRLHGGAMALEDNAPGLKIVLTLKI
jgi:signal transduction histidine kinase